MTQNFDLLTNSVSFFREAVRYAEIAEGDSGKWKFAIINLVQAMELALKEALLRIHPAFIYENVDRPESGKTISISKAISRLNSEHIGKSTISNSEAEQFESAIKIRNQFIHFQGEYQAEHVQAKFANTFAFMLFFYQDHLGLERDEVITPDQFNAILSLRITKKELLTKIVSQLETQGITNLWACFECGENTFVVDEEACRLCSSAEKIVDCPNCKERVFEFQLKDITDLFDTDEDEGLLVIYDRYDYESDACDNCIDDVKEDIKNRRFEKFANEMEEEFLRASFVLGRTP